MTRKAWTDSEVEYLRNSASESFLRDLATHLDRPEKMVRWKLGKLGLKAKDGRMSGLGGAPTTVWSEERMEYLQDHAQLLSARQIAENLGLTEKQIRHALNYFGIPGRGKGVRTVGPPASSPSRKPSSTRSGSRWVGRSSARSAARRPG